MTRQRKEKKGREEKIQRIRRIVTGRESQSRTIKSSVPTDNEGIRPEKRAGTLKSS